MNVREFALERNAELKSDALIQGVMGVGFSLLIFIPLWWVVSLLTVMWGGWNPNLALGITAVFVGVSFWSAWRKVDPYENLVPLTAAEATEREIEDAVGSLVGVNAGRVDGRTLAGCSSVLLGGPKALFGGWRAWRKRAQVSDDLLERAQSLLERADPPPPVTDDSRASLLLVHLGLASLEAGEDGTVRVHLTAKGKQLLG